MIDKSMGLKRTVDGIKFYGGIHSPASLMGENGVYISSPEMLTTPENRVDDMIRYNIFRELHD